IGLFAHSRGVRSLWRPRDIDRRKSLVVINIVFAQLKIKTSRTGGFFILLFVTMGLKTSQTRYLKQWIMLTTNNIVLSYTDL
ncbi:hypothetical protein, partial [[Muricauda] lutisoli]